jgi:hypothetical protein
MEDVLLEKDLGLPILQIKCQEGLVASGNKILQPGDCALAILHPRRLIIAAVTTSQNFSGLKEVYVHDFKRNCYNFVIGQFGGKTTACI